MTTEALKEGDELTAIWCPEDSDGAAIGVVTSPDAISACRATRIVIGKIKGPMDWLLVAVADMVDGDQMIIPLWQAQIIRRKHP